MGTKRSANILVSPLDWGLGHTTRCVPVIAHLLGLEHRVFFAGNTWQRDYISRTFPGIDTLHLEGYNVHYTKHGGAFMLNLLGQFPRLLKTIRSEHEWLKQAVIEHRIDGIISDNRYGLHHATLPSVIMTHQVMAQSGMGDGVDNMLSGIHYKRLQQFNKCWIIDVPGNPNLSGKLGHPQKLPRNAQFLGLLSQMKPAATSEEYVLILLSGPEPQRTILSDVLWQQAVQ
ncbi:MAG: glycosyl transferase family 28, partial [Sphingobacteriales bacterium]